MNRHRYAFVAALVDGHTWINVRNYLSEFAPQLFR
jgi:hypothetical protein